MKLILLLSLSLALMSCDTKEWEKNKQELSKEIKKAQKEIKKDMKKAETELKKLDKKASNLKEIIED